VNTNYCLVNDEIVAVDQAAIGINDLALQRGFGIFDYFKTLSGQPVFIDDHLERFYRSAKEMRLIVKYPPSDLKAMLKELMNKNDMPNSGIKLLLTGGYSPDGFNMGVPNLVVTQSGLPSYKSEHREGINIITHQYQRQMPSVKNIDYLMAVWLQPVIKERGADDVLYFSDNLITECPRANIFVVTGNNRVLTPANNILKGITRKQLLQLADSFDISEADITVDELKNAKEVFITSTTKNILPVKQIDDRVVGDGVRGGITGKLSQALVNIINEKTGW
jgi:branched-chain amino acid aminotransferase